MERINTPFTNEHFVDYCLKMVGHPYWYGCCGYKATQSLLTRKTNQYPSHYTSSRMSQYKKDIANKEVVSDCIGGVKGYAWTGGGIGVVESIGTDKTYKSSYGSNGCPDKGATGMFTWAKSKGAAWGTIDTLPEVPGLALYKEGHAGYYVGSGYAVEWRGFAGGCVKTVVSERPWTHWYQLPFIDYGDLLKTAKPASEVEYTLGTRSLAKGCQGNDVKTLQELLLQLGFALSRYGADGKYGSETETAVKTFQHKVKIKEDGVYGTETHTALMDALAEKDDGEEVVPAALGMTDEQKIWNGLLTFIGNPHGTAGLMGNLFAESALHSTNLQGTYEKKLNMTDTQYTAAVDSGGYDNFVHDSAGYGLAQWTYWSRKEALLKFAQAKGKSIGDLDMQLEFLKAEIGKYTAVMSVLQSAASVREASDIVLLQYEKPKDVSEAAQVRRAEYGQKYYDKYVVQPVPAQESLPGSDEDDRLKVTPILQPTKVTIVSKTGRVNIRLGNGTQYPRISLLKPGTVLEWIATAQNGWHAVIINGQVGWVSGYYSKAE